VKKEKEEILDLIDDSLVDNDKDWGAPHLVANHMNVVVFFLVLLSSDIDVKVTRGLQTSL